MNPDTVGSTDVAGRNDDKPPRHRLQKLTAVLNRQCKIVAEGIDSTMEAFIAALEELLRRANAARRQGIQLPTFLQMLRDQADR